MDRSEDRKMSIAARASRDAHVECAPILSTPLDYLTPLSADERQRAAARRLAGYAIELRQNTRASYAFGAVQLISDIIDATRPVLFPAENSAPDDTGSERSEHRDVPKPPTSNLSGEAG